MTLGKNLPLEFLISSSNFVGLPLFLADLIDLAEDFLDKVLRVVSTTLVSLFVGSSVVSGGFNASSAAYAAKYASNFRLSLTD